jgi:hypothetical protein
MKTVIVTMPMKKEVFAFKYPVMGNRDIEYDGKIRFPVNGVLTRTMKPKEQVKLIFLITRGGEDYGHENTKLFREELDVLNRGIGAEIMEDRIEIPFDPAKAVFDRLIRQLIDKIGKDAEIISDFTFGSKPFPFVLLCALNFAEMFNNASILYIMYGKVDFKPEPCNPMAYDITSLYYLQKLIGAMEGRNADTALKMLDNFFSL